MLEGMVFTISGESEAESFCLVVQFASHREAPDFTVNPNSSLTRGVGAVF
jgi:hypothetical protein